VLLLILIEIGFYTAGSVVFLWEQPLWLCLYSLLHGEFCSLSV